MIFEALLAHVTIAVRPEDEHTPSRIHAAWALALTNKKIRSELIAFIIEKDLVRFIHPLIDYMMWNPKSKDFDFIRAFLKHAHPDHQKKILENLKLKLGYRFFYKGAGAHYVPTTFGCELALLHQNLHTIYLELPVCPLLRPTNGMVLNYHYWLASLLPPYGSWGYITDMSDVQWPPEEGPGICLAFPFLNGDGSMTAVPFMDVNNDLAFYEHQTYVLLEYQEMAIQEILNSSLPPSARWWHRPDRSRIDVGYARTESGGVIWGMRASFAFKLDLCALDQRPTERSRSHAFARLLSSRAGTFPSRSAQTPEAPEHEPPNAVFDPMWRMRQRPIDQTVYASEAYLPQYQSLREGFYTSEVEKKGMLVVSVFDGNMDGIFDE